MARFQPSAPAKSERVKVAGAVHENSGSTIVRKVLYVTGRPARATMSHVEDGDQHSGLRGTFNRRKGFVICHRGRIRAHVEYHNKVLREQRQSERDSGSSSGTIGLGSPVNAREECGAARRGSPTG
jgi:hypothetical protein